MQFPTLHHTISKSYKNVCDGILCDMMSWTWTIPPFQHYSVNKTLLWIKKKGMGKYVYHQIDGWTREEFKINVITLVTLTDVYLYVNLYATLYRPLFHRFKTGMYERIIIMLRLIIEFQFERWCKILIVLQNWPFDLWILNYYKISNNENDSRYWEPRLNQPFSSQKKC